MAPDVRTFELARTLMAWAEARIADNARHVPPRPGATRVRIQDNPQ